MYEWMNEWISKCMKKWINPLKCPHHANMVTRAKWMNEWILSAVHMQTWSAEKIKWMNEWMNESAKLSTCKHRARAKSYEFMNPLRWSPLVRRISHNINSNNFTIIICNIYSYYYLFFGWVVENLVTASWEAGDRIPDLNIVYIVQTKESEESFEWDPWHFVSAFCERPASETGRLHVWSSISFHVKINWFKVIGKLSKMIANWSGVISRGLYPKKEKTPSVGDVSQFWVNLHLLADIQQIG